MVYKLIMEHGLEANDRTCFTGWWWIVIMKLRLQADDWIWITICWKKRSIIWLTSWLQSRCWNIVYKLIEEHGSLHDDGKRLHADDWALLTSCWRCLRQIRAYCSWQDDDDRKQIASYSNPRACLRADERQCRGVECWVCARPGGTVMPHPAPGLEPRTWSIFPPWAGLWTRTHPSPPSPPTPRPCLCPAPALHLPVTVL